VTNGVAGTLFDGTKIDVQLVEGGVIKASCTGLLDSLSEVVEILSWLGSALCASSGPPFKRVVHLFSKEKELHEPGPPCLKMEFLQGEDPLAEAFSKLGVSDESVHPHEAPGPISTASDGDCWKRVLRDPVVAMGFPVPIRPPGVPGLEIPLDAMALLVNAPRLTVFDHRAILKGYNAAIVLTDGSQDSIMRWHFICNENGSRLPYSDPRIRSSFLIEEPGALDRIQGARHVLGWATHVSYNIGMFPTLVAAPRAYVWEQGRPSRTTTLAGPVLTSLDRVVRLRKSCSQEALDF
jgi:hypothetical protein